MREQTRVVQADDDVNAIGSRSTMHAVHSREFSYNEHHVEPADRPSSGQSG